MIEQWTAQIEHMARLTTFWCDFAIVCGCIGFVLSIVAAIIFIRKIKEENND